MTTLTPAAERKRQQRARAAAGQVHRVPVYLTEEQKRRLDRLVYDARMMFPDEEIDAAKYITQWCL